MESHNAIPQNSSTGERGKDTIIIKPPENWEPQNEGLRKYEYLRIKLETNIPEPIPIVSINDECISTEGNITTISGASKSGKSAFAGWIIAGAISKDGIISDAFIGLKVEPNGAGKAVIHIDTEQARHRHQKNVKSILKRGNYTETPECYLSYNIRQLEIKDYQNVTSEICEFALNQFNGIHLIVIDGGADYIRDVNDAEQSNGIIKYFEDLAIRYSAPVIIIVHTNPGNDKERGHFGSQCQRKSESIITIKQDGDISSIEPKFLRNAGKSNISKVQFMFDKNKGYHVCCGIRPEAVDNKDAERLELIERLAKEAFAPPVSMKYKGAVERIMLLSKKKEATAKGYLKDMRAHEMIVQGDDKLWRLNMDR